MVYIKEAKVNKWLSNLRKAMYFEKASLLLWSTCKWFNIKLGKQTKRDYIKLKHYES
jgi:hypothetical protein